MYFVDPDFTMFAQLEVSNVCGASYSTAYSRDVGTATFIIESEARRDSYGMVISDETVHDMGNVTRARDAMVERMKIAFRDRSEFHYVCNSDCFNFNNRREQNDIVSINKFVRMYGDDGIKDAIMSVGEIDGEPDYVVFFYYGDYVRMMHFATGYTCYGCSVRLDGDYILESLDVEYVIENSNGIMHVHYLPF